MKRVYIFYIIFLVLFWIPVANPDNSLTINGDQVGTSNPITLLDNMLESHEYDTIRLTKSPSDLDVGDISISPTGQIEIAYSNWAGRDAFVSEPTSLDIMPTGINISPEADGTADNDFPFSILHDQNGTRWVAYRVGTTDTSETCYVRELGDGTLGTRYQVATIASSNGECDLVQWSNGSYSMIFSASNSIYTASSWHGYITHSSNLIDWTTPTQVTSDWGRMTRMTIDDNDRLWALIDNNNDGCEISYSDDGTSWQGTVTFPNTHYGDVAYSDYWDMLFFVYYNTTDNDVWFRTSQDGATWSDPIFAANSVSGIASMIRATVDNTGVLYLIYRDDVDGVADIFAARIHYVPETYLGLAVGTIDGRVHLYQFNGLGNPTLLWSNQLGTGLIDNIMVVDIDGDKQSEVLVAAANGYFYCLEGSTGFQRWNYSSPWANFVVWRDLFVEDLDQDGFYEIITAIECTTGGSNGGIVILEHTGIEKTRNDTIITSGHNGNGPDRIDMIDYNHDGVRDVVCLYGDTLYSGAQPRIQVLDYTSGIGVLLKDFSYTYTSSGMTGLLLADLNSDGEPDFITTGWGCPVAAFNNSGTFNWSYAATGTADKLAMYSDNIDGLGTNCIIIGTGQYSNTNGLTVSLVHAINGSEIVTPLTLGISASSFRPYAVTDVDSDDAKEIFLITDVVSSTSDRITSVDGLTGTEEWYVTVNKFADQILTPDLESDGKAELIIGEANGFTLVYGNGTKLWTETTDGIPYKMALAEPLSPLLFDHFDTNDTAYNPNLWTLETYGLGEILYENNTQIGLHVWGHAYRTLVSKENFSCDVRSQSKVKFSDANALPAFGWTDVIPNQWNYHPVDGNNGVWVEFNWPVAHQRS